MATKTLLNLDTSGRFSVAAYASDSDSDAGRKTEVATHINGPWRVSMAVAAADACDANRGIEGPGACSLCLIHAAEHCDHRAPRPAAPLKEVP